mgnify:CR=1 FL=1
MLKFSSRITIPVESPQKGIAIITALAPDNVLAPSDVEIKSDLRNGQLEIVILVTGDTGRFLHTLNDLLRCLVAIDKSINLLSQLEKKPVKRHASAKKSS